MACTCNLCWAMRLYESNGSVIPPAFMKLLAGVVTSPDDDDTDIDDEVSLAGTASWLDDATDLEDDLPSDGSDLRDLKLPRPALPPRRRKSTMLPPAPWFLGANGRANSPPDSKRLRTPTSRMNL